MTYLWNSAQVVENTKGPEGRLFTVAPLSRRIFAWREATVKPWAKLSRPFRAGIGSGFFPQKDCRVQPKLGEWKRSQARQRILVVSKASLDADRRQAESISYTAPLRRRGGYVEHRRNQRSALKGRA
jgi:hypothetical protein